MSNLESLKQQIMQLSPQDFERFRTWFYAYRQQREASTGQVLSMTEERSDELSRAMMKAIESIDPKKQRFVKA